MKPLKLKNPPSPGAISRTVTHCDRIASVSVKVPVVHLEGEYSYLVPEGFEIGVGSLVRVPFGSQRTTGFVTEVSDRGLTVNDDLGKLKVIEKIVGKVRWFDQGALDRARSIASLYGGSLYAILNLATPKRSGEKVQEVKVFNGCIPVKERHRRFITERFGDEWARSPRSTLILGPGMLWEQVVASLMLSESISTLVLLPNDSAINRLLTALKDAGVHDIAVIHSSRPESERGELHRLILEGRIEVLVGTRSAALAPFQPKQLIIVDVGDPNYREKRSPYFRVDEMRMWERCERIVAVNHVPTLAMLASESKLTYPKARTLAQNSFLAKSSQEMIKSISKEVRSQPSCSVLFSINDRSFVSSLICEKCRNPLRCECGFSLGLKQREAVPECNRCGKRWTQPRCKHCRGDRFISFKAGAEKWALMLGKSIPGSRIVISNADSLKLRIEAPEKGPLIVLATHGSEPLIVDHENRNRGYQVIALIGGNGLFNSSSFSIQEEGRFRWARALGLLSPKGGMVFADIDPNHPVYRSMRTGDDRKHLQESLTERRVLGLPPFSTIAEVKGEPSALARLRENLARDTLFQEKESALFPIQGERFLVKVPERKRFELLQLLQGVTKMRSSRRLSPVFFVLDPDYL